MNELYLNLGQRFTKRAFDLFVAISLLVVLSWLILISLVISRISTGGSGLFKQLRIGRFGEPFTVIKIRTMMVSADLSTTVTSGNDERVTKWGWLFRKSKIDELPQLINVLRGEMSIVGPRPDVPGYADKLRSEDRIILELRPGITGPASIKYRNEENSLTNVEDPEKYNDEVIWPDKVRINKNYIENYSFLNDLKYIILTLLPYGKYK